MAVRSLGMTPLGKNRPLQVEGVRGIVANLYAAQDRVVKNIRGVTRRAARQTRDLARQLAPVDTTNLRESITYDLSDQERTFVVYHDPEAFAGGPPYHVFQELGFRHYLSGEFIQNAHLFPAFEAIKPHYAADISKAVRYAIQQTRP